MTRVSSLMRNEWVLLGLITLVAILFRFYGLNAIPLGLHSDEAFNGYEATRVLGERTLFIFFEEELGEEPMHIHLIALLFSLFGESTLVIRATSALVGVVTVPFLYLLVKELFPVKDDGSSPSPLGLMAALWLALSYWHVSYSRLGMEPIMLPLFIIATSYFFWRAFKSGRKLHYLLAGLFIGLSLYIYRAARLVPFVFLVYIICYVLLTRRLNKQLFVRSLILFAVAFLVFAPLGYFALTHPDVYFSRAGDVSIFNPELNQGSPLQALITSTARTMASFHLLPDPNWRQNPAGRPLLDPITGLFFLVGLGIVLFRWRRPNYLFLLVWLFVMALPAVLTVSGIPHSSRSIGLLPVACILPAIGLYEATEWLRRRKPSEGVSRLVLLVTSVLFLLVALVTYRHYFTVWGREELPPAFDMAFVEAAEAMNSLDRPGGVWILPLTSLADPGSAHYTVEFLYTGDAPHYFLRTDEDTVAQELTQATQAHDEALVFEWDQSILGGAYLYHADPKGVLSFLLGKYGEEVDRKDFQAFDVVSYRLPVTPDFAIARSFQTLSVNFKNQIALRGIAYGGSSQDTTSSPPKVETQLLPSGKNAWVALQWEALGPLSRDYKAAVYLVDGRGRLLGQMDKIMLSNNLKMASEWPVGQVEIDYYMLSSPPATPPGEYYVELAVYDAETMNRLPVLDEEGKISGQSFRAGTIQVVSPLVPPQVEPQVEISEGDIAPGIRLLGYDSPLTEVEPGGTMRVALYWQALWDVEDDYLLVVGLRDEAGEVRAQQTDRPVDGTYPTTEWDEGEVLRDWHDVGIPPDTPQGRYEVFLKVMKEEVPLGEASLGEVEVRGRPHYFTMPEIDYPMEVMVGENIRLLGYDLEDREVSAGGVLWLSLYWQAVGEMETSYTVFTHLLDGNNQTWAQKDSVPGGGSLPTTSWIEGEVVTDIYDLVVDANAPGGEYVLEIGMYDAVTGERLPIYDSKGKSLGDRVLLHTINVLP
jgi:4-amino-4-deoxy-L-arabinose transferase-like glycosyltransferase